MRARTQLRVMYAGLLAVVVAGGALIAGAMRPAPAAENGAAARLRSVAGDSVVGADGRIQPLAPAGGGAVLVVSTGCPHCHRTLQRLARQAPGGRLPHLNVLVIEGPERGARMLDSLGVRAPVSGPRREDPGLLSRLGVTGTPTIIAVEGDGSVRRVVVGALSDEEAAVWAAPPSAPAGAVRP